MATGIDILSKPPSSGGQVLSAEALAFVEKLHRQFQPTRQNLLKKRQFTEFLTLPDCPYLE
jgi:malate synthase